MLQVRDLMTRDVLTVTPYTTLREAAELFTSRHISCAPVLSGHELVGLVSATDLLGFVASWEERRATHGDQTGEQGGDDAVTSEDEASSLFFWTQTAEGLEDDADSVLAIQSQPSDLFEDHTVDEVMTRQVCSISPQAFLTDAAQYMWKAEVHRLLILDRGTLVGILSSSDVSRAVAMQRVDLDGLWPMDLSAPDRCVTSGTDLKRRANPSAIGERSCP